MEQKNEVRVVAAIDFDDAARITLATAERLAGAEGKITVVHVAASGRQVRRHAEEASDAMVDDERRIREMLLRELGDASNPMWGKIDAQVGVGDAAEQIVQIAIDVEADFIVVGARERHGVDRLRVGSVTAEVSRRAPCSVVIARAPDYDTREKTVAIEEAPAHGEPSSFAPSPPVRGRPNRSSFYDANIVPTGIPRREVR